MTTLARHIGTTMFHGALLQNDAMTPAQFADLHESRARTGEQLLGVLESAYHDWELYRDCPRRCTATSTVDKRIHKQRALDVKLWVYGEPVWRAKLGFEACCELCGLEPEAVRRGFR